MLPFSILTTDFKEIDIDTKQIILILVIGIIHTGVAYILYYGSMPYLSSQTISIFCYFEPIISIALSIPALRACSHDSNIILFKLSNLAYLISSII